ncbi:TIGR03862 family flavoprotein [Acetobacteraceae bacterium ESL0709]|nr:TIGR03862 family flavoprotein [Acetobacteraceae bacterium ESL0697]MDF7677619.1 TIGR03862 family flavoprotein [Acetobacteraceae bacterium ESL0709]
MTLSPLTDTAHKRILIIGAGPSGLFAAECLAQKGYSVHLFDHMNRPGRKFLMAGRSGLNLTHSEPLERFLARYGKAQSWLEASLRAFPPQSLIDWAENLGQPCFTGSSGRVFLKSLKASPLLRAWLQKLQNLNVTFHPRHELTALHTGTASFQNESGPVSFAFDGCILALGGASWSRLGSDGHWSRLFPTLCAPFEPSNCGFVPDWSPEFCLKHEGNLLKSVSLSFAGERARGDLTLTRRGLEGAPLYALSPLLREAVRQAGSATLMMDFRPALSAEDIKDRLSHQRPRESLSNRLRKGLRLDRFSASLIARASGPETDPEQLAIRTKNCPLVLAATDTLDRAISSAGGLRFSALTDSFMLESRPGIFACGEMLDWEAPTGGYLLQACFSTAFTASQGVERWLSSSLSARL